MRLSQTSQPQVLHPMCVLLASLRRCPPCIGGAWNIVNCLAPNNALFQLMTLEADSQAALKIIVLFEADNQTKCKHNQTKCKQYQF